MLVHTPTVLDDICLCNFFSSATCFLDRELLSNIQVFLFSLCAFKMQTVNSHCSKTRLFPSLLLSYQILIFCLLFKPLLSTEVLFLDSSTELFLLSWKAAWNPLQNWDALEPVLSCNAARHSCISRIKDNLAAQQWLLTWRAFNILAKKDPPISWSTALNSVYGKTRVSTC